MKSSGSYLEMAVTTSEALEEVVSLFFEERLPWGWVAEYLDMPATSGQDKEKTRLRLKGYWSINEAVDHLQRRLFGEWEAFCTGAGLEPLEPSFRVLEAEDWAVSWQENFPPNPVGQRFLILPPWSEEPARSRIPLIIPPGQAFGTGLHETTRHCLELLEEAVEPGQRIVEAGCGSGVLSFAALKLGAGEAFACDIDEDAVAEARVNARLNGVEDRCEIVTGNFASWKVAPGDGLIGNLLASVILAILPRLVEAVKPGGWLLLSGIERRAEESVREAVERFGFALNASRTGEDFVTLLFQKH